MQRRTFIRAFVMAFIVPNLVLGIEKSKQKELTDHYANENEQWAYM